MRNKEGKRVGEEANLRLRIHITKLTPHYHSNVVLSLIFHNIVSDSQETDVLDLEICLFEDFALCACLE